LLDRSSVVAWKEHRDGKKPSSVTIASHARALWRKQGESFTAVAGAGGLEPPVVRIGTIEAAARRVDLPLGDNRVGQLRGHVSVVADAVPKADLHRLIDPVAVRSSHCS
jgi:hypothetical protein